MRIEKISNKRAAVGLLFDPEDRSDNLHGRTVRPSKTQMALDLHFDPEDGSDMFL
jgi:hypothetical protein